MDGRANSALPHSAAGLPAGIEWPTLALGFAILASWLALVWFHGAMPLWLWLPLAAWASAWWGSFQHEALHGHPTPSTAVNEVLATPPLWLWLPYARYRQTHLIHHRDARLTDPLDDPESRFVTGAEWARMSTLARALVRAQMTLAGRVIIGPLWIIPHFLAREARAIVAGDRRRAAIYAWHAVTLVPVLVFAFGVARIPVWQYLAGFVYGGLALTLIRSFAEHRADAQVTRRTIIVENALVLGLLFLNNNLHAAHHRWPGLAWYRLPARYREHRAALIAANGGQVYDGYRALVRRYALRPFADPVHPLGRAP